MYYNERLKQLRERVGNSQKEIAKILDIHKGLYSHYETEDYIMPIKHLIICVIILMFLLIIFLIFLKYPIIKILVIKI